MRCFIAVDIEDDVRYDIAKLQEEIKDYDVTLVEPKNLHFTVKFLGDVNKDQVGQIKATLEDIASATKPFEISLHGLGAFPDLNYIKVIWIGDENNDLLNLQRVLDERFPGAKEPVSHLTIARVRGPQHKKELADFVTANKHLWIGKLKITEIKIKRSYLSPKGPKYEDLAVMELGKNE